jgi:hypothetical protein
MSVIERKELIEEIVSYGKICIIEEKTKDKPTKIEGIAGKSNIVNEE